MIAELHFEGEGDVACDAPVLGPCKGRQPHGAPHVCLEVGEGVGNACNVERVERAQKEVRAWMGECQ
jgi:hypothetical protein